MSKRILTLKDLSKVSSEDLRKSIMEGKRLSNESIEKVLERQGWRLRSKEEIIRAGDVLWWSDAQGYQLADGYKDCPVSDMFASDSQCWTLENANQYTGVQPTPPIPVADAIPKKTQQTYLKKVFCNTQGCNAIHYTCRVTAKWMDKFGAPQCPSCSKPMIAE